MVQKIYKVGLLWTQTFISGSREGVRGSTEGTGGVKGKRT